MTIAYRFALPADAAFICDGWIRSYRNSDTAGPIPFSRWRGVMWPIVEALQMRPGTSTIVACDASDPGSLYGVLCSAAPIVHYCYVKQAFRRFGIARGLFRAAGIDPEQPFTYSFKTAAVSELAAKIPLAKWDPMAARVDPQQQQERQR